MSCADDIGLNKRAGTIDAAINMTFGGQVHDRLRLVARDRLLDGLAVSDVDLLELVARMIGNVGERGEVSSVRQRIHVEDLVALSQGQANEVAADEAGTASDEEFQRAVFRNGSMIGEERSL